MKRDMDLIRKILIKIEDSKKYPIREKIKIEEYEDDSINFHLILLEEAGLVEVDLTKMGDGKPIVDVSRLTWEGYEFLDSSRNNKVWNKAKSLVMKKTSGLTFTILKDVLISIVREAILNN